MPFILSLRHRFAFIHVPKTGGLSLYKNLEGFGDRSQLLKDPMMGKVFAMQRGIVLSAGQIRAMGALTEHATAQELRTAVGAACFDSLYSFAVLRNPWERELSNYTYACQFEGSPHHARMLALGSFEAYVDQLTVCGEQLSFVADELGRPLVSKVLDFANLDRDYKAVLGHLGLPDIPLPHINKTAHAPWQSYYTPETFAKVAVARQADIAVMGLSQDPADYGIR